MNPFKVLSSPRREKNNTGDAHIQVLLLCIPLLIAINSSACTLNTHSDRQEIEDLPGAVILSGGSSSVPELYQMAAEHLGNHEFEEGEAIYRKVISIEPDKANGYIGLGASLIYQDRVEEAYEAYLEALHLSPDSISALIGLGSTCYLRRDYQTAEDYYARALELDPNQPDAHWGSAITLEMLGREMEAIHHLEQFILLAPDSQQLEKAQRMLEDFQTR